jgi:hypothetical protein
LVTLAALVLGVRAAYQTFYGERDAIRALRERGADITSEFDAPTFIETLAGLTEIEHAVVVEMPDKSRPRYPPPFPPPGVPLADADEVSQVCRQLVQMPRLRELSLEDQPVDDRHLKHFRRLKNLNSLRVRGSEITIAGIEQLVDEAPDIDIDVACGESLYRASLEAVVGGVCRPQEAVFGFETAANWKLACAEFKPEGVEAAALEQLIEWLDRLAAHLERKIRPGPGNFTTPQVAYVKCALTEARVKLALAKGDKRAAVRVAQSALPDAAELVALDVRKLPTTSDYTTAAWGGWWTPTELVRALERAAAVELAPAGLTGDRDAELDALQRYVDNLDKLLDHLHSPFDETTMYFVREALVMTRVWQAGAHARMARAAGNESEEIKLLEESAADRASLRNHVFANAEAGTIVEQGLIMGWQSTLNLDIALAQAKGDARLESDAQRWHRAFVAQRWVRANLPSTSGGPSSHTYLLNRCLFATEELRHRGRKYYESPVRELDPDDKRKAQIRAEWQKVFEEVLERRDVPSQQLIYDPRFGVGTYISACFRP